MLTVERIEDWLTSAAGSPVVIAAFVSAVSALIVCLLPFGS
jgi:hypothetical protein